MNKNLEETDVNKHLNLKTYFIGFFGCLVLTLGSYLLVVNEIFSGRVTFIIIAIFALEQFILQSYLFLHVGQEKKPKYNMAIYLYTIMTVLVLVVGTMWIMFNLQYNHSNENKKTPQEIEKFLLEEENHAH